MSGLFAGRAVVVTGVTSGIGAALVTRLLAEGAEVAGLGRDVDKLAAAATRWGARFIAVQADLRLTVASDSGRSRSCGSESHASTCSSTTPPRSSTPPRSASRRRAGPRCSRSTCSRRSIWCPGSRRSSDPGRKSSTSPRSPRGRCRARPKLFPYALTKAALKHLAEGLRMELAPRGVKVSLIVPGLVDTPAYDRVEGFDAARKALRSQVPEWLTADDVADAMMWMLTRPPGS